MLRLILKLQTAVTLLRIGVTTILFSSSASELIEIRSFGRLKDWGCRFETLFLLSISIWSLPKNNLNLQRQKKGGRPNRFPSRAFYLNRDKWARCVFCVQSEFFFFATSVNCLMFLRYVLFCIWKNCSNRQIATRFEKAAMTIGLSDVFRQSLSKR